MSATPATVALDAANITYRVLLYDHDPSAPSWGLEAAEVLGLDPFAVFKTLCAVVDGGTEPGEMVVGIVPVAGKLDLKALARAAGAKKATMADPSVAERVTGYVVGGISPIGQRRKLRTFIDEMAELSEEIFVSGGRRGLDLGVAPQDLILLLDAVVAPVATG